MNQLDFARNTDGPSACAVAAFNPGLDNDDLTLAEVLVVMPKDAPADIPWYVRLLENPASPCALAGAIDLYGHDCVHVLLGRGLCAQDEAFVIGYTMGASGRLTRWQELLFRWCSRHVYRAPYRLSACDEVVFGLGAAVGTRAFAAGAPPLETVDFRALAVRRLRELRAALGIDRRSLVAAYALEHHLFPDSVVSQRLPAAAERSTIAA